MKNISLEFKSIGYESYGKISEYLKNFFNMHIPTSTLYYHYNQNAGQYIEEQEKYYEKEIKKLNKKEHGVYCYDEQHTYINKKLHYRLTIIDANTLVHLNEKFHKKEEFTKETVKNFLETSLKDKKK